MSVRPGLKADHGLLPLAPPMCARGHEVPENQGPTTWGLELRRKSTNYRAVSPRVLASTCWDHCIHGQLVEARYSQQSMDEIDKYELFSWRPYKPPRSRRLSPCQGLPYLMTDGHIRVGDGRGAWTVQTIRALNLRKLLHGGGINTEQTRCRVR